MVYESLAEKLESDLSETKRHHAKGNERIKAWYSDDVEPPDVGAELNQNPHQSILEDGAKVIDFASGRLTETHRRMNDAQYDSELVMYGVGFERILTAAHLKLKPKSFIEKLEQDGETPSFQKSRNVMFADLSDRLVDEQMKVLSLTMELVREHRNNEAHFGFHRHRSFQLDAVLLDVSSKLIQQYSENEFDTLHTLLERAKERKPEGWEYSWDVEFDPEGRLDG